MAIARNQSFYSAKLTRGLTLSGSETTIYVDTNPTETSGYLYINPRSENNRELIKYTGVATSPNSLTGVTRGLALAHTTGSAISEARVAANCKRHSAGEAIEMNPGHYETLMSDILGGNTAMANNFNMGSNKAVSLGTPTANTDGATKAYVDGVAIAGAPDANATTKGIVEKASAAEAVAGAADGSGDTTAPLALTSSIASSVGGASKVVVSATDALIDDSLLGLTTAGDIPYSDGTDIVRLAKGTTGYFLEAGASAPTWGGANLAEANTFFGSTDITAAEAETLTDGSDATAKHRHDEYENAYNNINNNVKAFIGGYGDGFTGGNTANGTIERGVWSTHFDTQAAGADAFLYSGNPYPGLTAGSTNASWNANPAMQMFASLKMSHATSQDVFFGFGLSGGAFPQAAFANATNVDHHAGFMVDDGTLYASCADGATQNRVDISSGVTLTNFNLYEIEVSGGSSIVFKINGTTKATLDTNLPNGANMYFCGFVFTGTDALTRNYQIRHPYGFKLTNLT